MSQLLTISQITRRAAPVFRNNLAFTSAVNKQYGDEFAVKGAKIGSIVNVRIPPRYTVSTGPALDLQDSVETYAPVRITNQDHVDIPFTTADLTLSIDDFSQRFLEPAMASLANKVDINGVNTLYKQVANHTGTVGGLAGFTTSQQGTKYIRQARQRLTELGVPDTSDLAFLVNPDSATNLISLFSNVFNPGTVISQQFTKGALGDRILGFNFAETANMPIHTYGTYVQGTSPAITASAAFTGNTGPGTDRTASYAVTIVLASAGTQTLTAGTPITFANVYEVNPQTRQSTGSLKQFVITSDVTFNGTTPVTANIWPAPVFTGAFQNASSTTNTIASGAAVTVPTVTASQAVPQNLAFHPSAFTLATADLDLVNDGVTMARTTYDGLAIRTTKGFLPATDQAYFRIDVLYGWACIYPEMAVRVTT